QLRVGGRTVVADVVACLGGRPVAGDRMNQTGLHVDHADAVVQRVGDVDVAVGCARDRARRVERRLGRGFLGAVVPVVARPGDGGDDAGRLIDTPNPIVVGVGDDEIAVWCNRDAVRRVQLRGRCVVVVAGESGAEVVVAGDGDNLLRLRVDH